MFKSTYLLNLFIIHTIKMFEGNRKNQKNMCFILLILRSILDIHRHTFDNDISFNILYLYMNYTYDKSLCYLEYLVLPQFYINYKNSVKNKY